MLRFIFRYFIILIVIMGVLFDQNTVSKNLNTQFQDIKRFIENQMEQYHIPDLSLGIIHNNKTVQPECHTSDPERRDRP